MMWSVFIVFRLVERDLSPVFGKEKHWMPELTFYMGDWSTADFKNDWRFKEVKDKRKELVFMGLCENPEFPIKYPLQLLNGKVIDSEYNVNEK